MYTPGGDAFGVFGQRYDSAGRARGAEFRASRLPAGSIPAASVAMDGAGDFVVVWDQSAQAGSSSVIQGARYRSDGASQGAPFQIAGSTRPSLGPRSVGMDSEGDFVVSWSSKSVGPGGSYVSHIRARRYGPSGSPRGVEFSVDSSASGYHQAPALAMGPEGDFVVSWLGQNEEAHGDSVFVRDFDGSGTARAPELKATLNDRSQISSPDVGLAGPGSFVVVWTSPGDGDGFAILGRRFDLAPTTVLPALPDAGRAAIAVLGACGLSLALYRLRRHRDAGPC